MRPVHYLKHAHFSDGTFTPACACGWYSQRRQHADFEQHMRQVSDPQAADGDDRPAA